MKWYHVIPCGNPVKNPLVCDVDNFADYGYSEYSFKQGEYITNWNNAIFVQSSKKIYDGEPDSVLQNAQMLPIFSPELVEKTEESGIVGIQFLPIKVIESSGEQLFGFQLANILNVVEALDLEKSVVDRYSIDFPNPKVAGRIGGIRKFVIKRECVEGLDIIRLSEKNLVCLVSERFKRMFVANRFTGYEFESVDFS